MSQIGQLRFELSLAEVSIAAPRYSLRHHTGETPSAVRPAPGPFPPSIRRSLIKRSMDQPYPDLVEVLPGEGFPGMVDPGVGVAQGLSAMAGTVRQSRRLP